MVRYLWIAIALWAVQSASAASPAYANRREELRKSLRGDGFVVLFGRTGGETGDLRSGFFQEPNFYYLTGWSQPGAVLIVEPKGDILFLPAKNPEAEKWTGPKLSAADPSAAAETGIARVMPVAALESELTALMRLYPRVGALKGTPAAARLERFAPLRDLFEARPEIAKLRMKKSPEEISFIQRSTDVSVKAHLAAWNRAAEGVHEYEIAGLMEGVFRENGCERPAYTPIVGSGPNSVVLHYSQNRRRIGAGEVLLMDVAAECAGYTSDITRTIPVGGKFTARQREIYDIVLGAQQAAIAALKPGVTIGRTTPNSIYKVAYDYIEARGYGKYFTHGVGHHVGLEVHDADTNAPLEPGMIVTVEPGIYIPEENLGVRIEDVVLITETGAKVLSAELPKDPAGIEKLRSRQ
jgi:Xaa-Pro aminopeptidase